MKVTDTLDKGKQYCLSNITLEQKTQIFIEVFGVGATSALSSYLVGGNKDVRLCLKYEASWSITSTPLDHASDLRGAFAPTEFKYITNKNFKYYDFR